jgi:hypothetical protein
MLALGTIEAPTDLGAQSGGAAVYPHQVDQGAGEYLASVYAYQ